LEFAIAGIDGETLQAAGELPAMVAEVQSAADILAQYYLDVADYLASTSSVLPHLVTLTDNMSSDRLLTRVQVNKYSAVDKEAGAMTSTIWRIASIKREVVLRQQTKSTIYAMAIGDMQATAGYERGESGKTISDLKSMSPSQREGA
jgi:hypothetical protein